jgi:hypothetical protein
MNRKYTAHNNVEKTYVNGWAKDPNAKVNHSLGFGCLIPTNILVAVAIVAISYLVH